MSTQKSYKTFWDDKASTTKGALLAVDGSANEQVLQLTGAYSARQVATAPLCRRIRTYSSSGASVPCLRQVASQTSA